MDGITPHVQALCVDLDRRIIAGLMRDILRHAQNHLLRHYTGGETLKSWLYASGDGEAFRILASLDKLPTVADLDAIAEEQRIKEQTSGNQH